MTGPWSPPHRRARPLLAPQPPIAPLTPPVHVVDLMTVAGSAVFGARWASKAKITFPPNRVVHRSAETAAEAAE